MSGGLLSYLRKRLSKGEGAGRTGGWRPCISGVMPMGNVMI